MDNDQSHTDSAKKPRKPRAKKEDKPTIKGVELLFVPGDDTAPNGEAPAKDEKQFQGAPITDNQRETHGKTVGKEDTSEQDSHKLASYTPPEATNTNENAVGDVAISSATVDSLDGSPLARETAKQDAHRRWRNEGIAERVAAFRDRARSEYVKANPKCKRRDAQEHAWIRAMAEFPPAGVAPVVVEPEATEVSTIVDIPEPIEAAPKILDAPPADMGVSGLGDLPEAWGVLPANAQLQVEISWVSANRLRVRSGSGVDLSRALSPAPSYSALSWLETSILFPSKFADISVKATANQDDEREGIRREKLAIEEIRGLLAEMLEG